MSLDDPKHLLDINTPKGTNSKSSTNYQNTSVKDDSVHNTKPSPDSSIDHKPEPDGDQNSNQDTPASNRDVTSILLGRLRNESVNFEDTPAPKSTETVEHMMAKIAQLDHETHNSGLVNTLSPQLSENEIQKRSFKEQLINYLLKIIIVQTALIFIPVHIIIIVVCFDFPYFNNITLEQQQLLFDFLKYFITAILAEFLAMLFFIVRSVFDKSIVDLVKGLFQNNKTK